MSSIFEVVMKGSVLVVNASYEYRNVTSVRRALSLLLKKNAEVVETPGKIVCVPALLVTA